MTTPPEPRQRLRDRLWDAARHRATTPWLRDVGAAVTGGEFLARAHAMDEALADLPPGSRIGVVLPPSTAQALAVLALLGSRHVPSVLDPWHPPRGRLKLAAVVDGTDGEPRVSAPRVLRLDAEGHLVAVQAIGGGGSAAGEGMLPAEAGLVLHTSGSTGTPKAVVLPAAGLTYTVDQLIDRCALDRDTVAAVSLPLHHTMALNTQLLPALCAGGRATFFAGGLRLGRIYRDILESGATFVALVAELLAPCEEDRRRHDVPTAVGVRCVQLAGGAIGRHHLDVARALFPHARIVKGYGLTEAIRVAMITSDDPGFGEPGARVLDGQAVRIVDDEWRAVPNGPGRVQVRGPNVMLGYDHGGALERRPVIDAEGWLDTGDIGSLSEDGRLIVEGRSDRVFKSFGHRVSAAEIERAARTCSGVGAVVALDVACSVRGRRPLLFAEARLSNGASNPADTVGSALERALIRELAPYKVPKDIVFVSEVPRSTVGKVDAVALETWWDERQDLEPLGRGAAGCRFHRRRDRADAPDPRS